MRTALTFAAMGLLAVLSPALLQAAENPSPATNHRQRKELRLAQVTCGRGTD